MLRSIPLLFATLLVACDSPNPEDAANPEAMNRTADVYDACLEEEGDEAVCDDLAREAYDDCIDAGGSPEGCHDGDAGEPEYTECDAAADEAYEACLEAGGTAETCGAAGEQAYVDCLNG